MLEWVEGLDSLWTEHAAGVRAICFAAAFAEYLFPPFPGDVLAVSALLLGLRHGNALEVYTLLTAGAAAGCALTSALGRHLAKKSRRLQVWRKRLPLLARGEGAIARNANWVLLSNRFIPGIRGVLFLAAGAAGVSWTRAVVLGTIAAALHNALLVALAQGLALSLQEIGRVQLVLALLVVLVWTVVFVTPRWRRWRRGGG